MKGFKNGEKIVISFGSFEIYRGIIQGDWIVYRGFRNSEPLPEIVEQAKRGLCEIYKEVAV